MPQLSDEELRRVYADADTIRRARGGERMEGSGMSGDAQDAANELVDSAQKVANSVVDLGEEAARTVLGAVIEANRLLGSALETISKKLVG
jgi:hypothetical protein